MTGIKRGGNPSKLKPFQKGQSGNPGGRPKGIEANVREFARTYTKAAIETLGAICVKGKNENARIAASVALLERGWGKPLQQVEVKRTPFDELSPTELHAIAEALEALSGDEGGTAGGREGQVVEGKAVRVPPVH